METVFDILGYIMPFCINAILGSLAVLAYFVLRDYINNKEETMNNKPLPKTVLFLLTIILHLLEFISSILYWCFSFLLFIVMFIPKTITYIRQIIQNNVDYEQ